MSIEIVISKCCATSWLRFLSILLRIKGTQHAHWCLYILSPFSFTECLWVIAEAGHKSHTLAVFIWTPTIVPVFTHMGDISVVGYIVLYQWFLVNLFTQSPLRAPDLTTRTQVAPTSEGVAPGMWLSAARSDKKHSLWFLRFRTVFKAGRTGFVMWWLPAVRSAIDKLELICRVPFAIRFWAGVVGMGMVGTWTSTIRYEGGTVLHWCEILCGQSREENVSGT